MSPENRRRNAREEWALSEEAFAAGESLLESGHHRSAVGRLYYACFHAARAGLLAWGDEPKSHAGVRSLFNRRFVQEGDLDALTAAALSSLQQEREDADYSPGVVFSREDAEQAREVATLFVEAVRRRLQDRGIL